MNSLIQRKLKINEQIENFKESHNYYKEPNLNSHFNNEYQSTDLQTKNTDINI